MNTPRKLLKSTLLLILLFGLLSCSDNSSGPDENEEEGETSITITGDFDAEKTGEANFKGEQNIGKTWAINIYDEFPQTFHVFFQTGNPFGTDQATRPGPGTYSIGFDESDNSIFSAEYTAYSNDGELHYTTNTDLCGESAHDDTLTIESSTAESVEGSFEFDAVFYTVDGDLQCDYDRIITVSGQFKAEDGGI